MKIIRIDMENKSAKEEKVPIHLKKWGGRGFTSTVIKHEVPPTCDPLSKENKLILAPGLLGGTSAPCSGRLSVGAKSPLTGGIKESNSGGTAAQDLAKLGIKGIIIEGKPGKGQFHLIEISDAGIKFLPAGDYMGMGNYDFVESMVERYGEKISTLSIGPAGENRLHIAGIAVGDIENRPVRFAARGGLGAVMAAKGIKGIVIKRTNKSKIGYADRHIFRENAKKLAKQAVEAKQILTEYGTASLVGLIQKVGGLPTRNFSRGRFEKAEEISGEKLKSLVEERGGQVSHNCNPGCVIRCSNVFNDKEGNYLTASLEYETIGLMGSNLGIGNLDQIATLDQACDNYGIDTIEMGGALGVAMEAGLLEFGDFNGALELIEEVAGETKIGRLLGSGTEITGKVLGVDRIPTVKGQGMAAYDPRALKGTGVTYATSPMGADHTAGNCLPGRGGFLGENKDGLETHKAEGQVKLSRDLQIMFTIVDYLGFCFFIGVSPDNLSLMAGLVKGRYGFDHTRYDLIDQARELLSLENDFNKEAGFSRKENKLPLFFREEPLYPHNSKFDVKQQSLEKFKY